MESVKAVRYQAAELCNVPEELQKTLTNDAQAKSNAQSLISQMINGKFQASQVFWHSLLYIVICVSKEFQSDTMDVSTVLLFLFQNFVTSRGHTG